MKLSAQLVSISDFCSHISAGESVLLGSHEDMNKQIINKKKNIFFNIVCKYKKTQHRYNKC